MMSERRTFREGVRVGLIAYATVAIFYSGFDLLAARGTLFTVDMLGKAVFRGLRDPAVLLFPQQLDLAAIFWYNGLHLIASLVIGVIVTLLVAHAERHPTRARVLALAVFTGGALTVLTIGTLTEGMRSVLPWWSIIVANVLAAILAGFYLLARTGARPALLGPWRHA